MSLFARGRKSDFAGFDLACWFRAPYEPSSSIAITPFLAMSSRSSAVSAFSVGRKFFCSANSSFRFAFKNVQLSVTQPDRMDFAMFARAIETSSFCQASIFIAKSGSFSSCLQSVEASIPAHKQASFFVAPKRKASSSFARTCSLITVGLPGDFGGGISRLCFGAATVGFRLSFLEFIGICKSMQFLLFRCPFLELEPFHSLHKSVIGLGCKQLCIQRLP